MYEAKITPLIITCLRKKTVKVGKTDLEDFKKEYNENNEIGEDLGGGFRKIRE